MIPIPQALDPGGDLLAGHGLLLQLEAMPGDRLMQQRGDVAAGDQHPAGCGRLGSGRRSTWPW